MGNSGWRSGGGLIRTACVLLIGVASWALTLLPACSSGSGGGGAGAMCSYPGALGFCVCDGQGEYDPVPECSAATMGGPVVCCQGEDSCNCGLFLCSSYSSDSCSCTSVGVGNTADACTGDTCCATTGGTCSCGQYCSGDSVKVDSCSADTALCGEGKTRVEKCLPP